MTHEATSEQGQGFRAFVRVLRNRNFFWLWVSQLISMVGDFFSFLAVPYLITVLAEGESAAAAGATISAEAKALVGLSTFFFTAPRLLGIFTGVFVDRWDRQRTMILANLAAGSVVLLPIMAGSLDMVWLIILAQFLLALATRFIQPTQQAVLPLLVEEDDLLAANGLMSMSMTIGIIIGPMVAGVTVETLGVRAAFVVDSLTFLAAAAIIRFLVRIPPLADAPEGKGWRALLGEVRSGIRFIFVTPLLLATVISFAILQGGLGGINAMWVPFLRETFGRGPIGITMVDTAQGVGMALGAVALGFLMARMSKMWIAFVGVLGIGAALAGMGLAPSFVLVIVWSVLLGILLVPAQSAINTLMMLAIPKTMQGRVFSSFFAITQAASLLMIGVITALVAAIPLRAIFVGGGLAVMLAGVVWLVLVRGEARALEAQSTVPAAAD
jgi:DHA3 family macrolide efflux protein-like MFS transporter